MQEPAPEEPVDILADAPAEVSEELPGQMEADAPPEKAESEEMQATTSKKYKNEDVYTMISIVLRYPSGGHGGETFWTWMVKIYGNSLLEGRNGSGLRNRWRKISKEHASDLAEYKKQLAEGLSKEFIENVDKKIEESIADVGSLGLSSKAYSSLFPELSKPVDHKETERLARKRKPEDNNIEGEERKKVKKISNKGGIDLDTLVPKLTHDLSSLIEDNDEGIMSAKITLGKNLLITRDLKTNACSVKSKTEVPVEEYQFFKKPEVRQCDILRDSAGKANTNIKQWNELEDMILRHPENIDLNNCLIKTKGAEEVAKRKQILGLI